MNRSAAAKIQIGTAAHVLQNDWSLLMKTYVASPEYVESRSEAEQPDRESASSGISWSAVIGGSFVIATLYLILLALGAGFGLSAVSPWSSAGLTAATTGSMAIAWLIVIEIISSAFGGYLAGRLRTKWTAIHSDEVFFRDTASGFLAWAVALVVSIAFLASAAASMTGGAMQARALENAPATTLADPNMYFIDALFRSDRAATDVGNAATKTEAERIVVKALAAGQMPASDQSYLERLVSDRTGISQPDAATRVSQVITEARQAEDAVRKATAHFLLRALAPIVLPFTIVFPLSYSR
jgi:hypothetical protein